MLQYPIMVSTLPARNAAWLLSIFLFSTVFCPCRGVVGLFPVASESAPSPQCKCCGTTEEGPASHPAPDPQKCDCANGCCALFTLPDTDGEAVSLDPFLGCFVISEHVSCSLASSRFSPEGASSSSSSPHPIGTLFPELSSLLL